MLNVGIPNVNYQISLTLNISVMHEKILFTPEIIEIIDKCQTEIRAINPIVSDIHPSIASVT